MNVVTLSSNTFLSQRERTMTFGTVGMTTAFSILLQCMSYEKSRQKVSVYKFANSVIILGKFTWTANTEF